MAAPRLVRAALGVFPTALPQARPPAVQPALPVCFPIITAGTGLPAIIVMAPALPNVPLFHRERPEPTFAFPRQPSAVINSVTTLNDYKDPGILLIFKRRLSIAIPAVR